MPSTARAPVLSNLTRINLGVLCIFLILFALLGVAERLPAILILLGVTLLLTYILLAPVVCLDTALQRWTRGRLNGRQSRTLTIILVYLLFFGALLGGGFRFLPPLAGQIESFSRHMPAYLAEIEAKVGLMLPTPEIVGQSREQSGGHAGGQFGEAVGALPAGMPQASVVGVSVIQSLGFARVADLVQQMASGLTGFLLVIGATTLSGFVYSLTTLVMTFYLLHDGRQLSEGLVHLMPTRLEVPMRDFLDRLHTRFFSFVKSQIIVSLLAGGMMYLLLKLLGIQYALMLASSFGVACIIPVLGPCFGLLPILLMVALRGSVTSLLALVLALTLLYLVKIYWLWPRLLGRDHDIHPVPFILTFLICLKTVGFLGILLCFPLASLLSVLFDVLKTKRRSSRAGSRDKA